MGYQKENGQKPQPSQLPSLLVYLSTQRCYRAVGSECKRVTIEECICLGFRV